MKTCNFRIGYGYDVHRFTKGRKLILGGVDIPYKAGLAGHSDADVLIHSVCDALLGAAGLKDIGHQFPNTDPEFKNISSLLLLKETYRLISKKKFNIGNIDCMLSLEEPKIYKFINEIKKNISAVIKTENISIKATTSEGLGFVGKKEGCEATCVALLYK